MPVIVGVALGVMALIGYGISDYLGAISSKKIGGFQSVAISRALSLLMLAPPLFLFFNIPSLTWDEALLLVVAAILADLALILFYKALKVGNVSVAASISGAYPAITVVLLLAFFSTNLTYLQSLSIFLIIAGTVLASFRYKDLRRLRPRNLEGGSKYALLSALAFGINAFLEVVLVKELGWFALAFLVYLVMLLYNSVYSIIFKVRFANVGTAIFPLILTGVATTLGFLAFNYAVVLNYAVIATPLAGACTIVTVLLAFVLLKERPDASQNIGIALIIAGAIALSVI